MQERAQNLKRTKQGSRSLDSPAKKGAKRACTVSRAEEPEAARMAIPL